MSLSDQAFRRLATFVKRADWDLDDLLADEVTIGYRFIDKDFQEKPKVGDILPHSYTWEGDEWTDEELKGTSAFEDRQQVEEYAKHSKGRGWLVTLSTEEPISYGDLPGEIIMPDAEVTEVEEW